MFSTTTYCRNEDLLAIRQRRLRGLGVAAFIVTSVFMLGVQLTSF